MGLIKELDDQIGRLLEYLEQSAQMKNTMIVFTSDHGENLGDHWLGEKDLFFDCSARVPLIIYDPRQEADKTRGTSTDHLVEAIDLVQRSLKLWEVRLRSIFWRGDRYSHSYTIRIRYGGSIA
jgi:arylsulfatase A-like enzyme